MKRALFIGRWQTPHLHGGHIWCFEQKLKQGIPIGIGIRDVEIDEKNPYPVEHVKDMIEKHYDKEIESGMVMVFILPFDIESVVVGRGVGYAVEELIPPQEIADISATKIREELRKKGGL
ncbi:MAG: cytidyltransferase [Candidatus Kapaibacteriota bacterium]